MEHATVDGSENAARLSRGCPICAGTEAQAHPHTRDDWHLQVCMRCGFVYLQDPPDYRGLDNHYAWQKTHRAERARRRQVEPVRERLSWVVRKIRRNVLNRNKLQVLVDRYIPAGRILDIGCGRGTLLARFLDGRHEPWGVEISEVLARDANELFAGHGGRCIHSDTVSGLNTLPQDHFDGIIMSSYLEHEIEPLAVCEGISRCLKPGGHVVIKVPNYASWNRLVRGAKWCGYRFPDHVNYFTPASLSRLIGEVGLQVARFRWQDRFPTSDSMWLVARRDGG